MADHIVGAVQARTLIPFRQHGDRAVLLQPREPSVLIARPVSEDRPPFAHDQSTLEVEGADIAEDLIDAATIVAVNKIDLGKPRGEWGKEALASFPISVLTGEGIKELLLGLESAVKERIGVTESPVITRARHRDAVQDCLSALDRFRTAQLPELAAEDLRMAVRALGRITGRVDVEDLLDVIFRDFCIGK